jgi:cytochrome c
LQRGAGVSPKLDPLCGVSLFALRPAWLKRATVKLEEIRPMRSLLLSAALILASADAASAQDAAAGEKVFAQCRACHQIGETAKNAVGPVLNGLFGRHSGSVEGYSYSPANKNSGITWDEPTFREYIKDPKAKIPGTKMIFAGVKDDKRIDDLIAYLKQFDATGKKK